MEKNFDRDAVGQWAFTSFMDPVCPFSGSLSDRGFLSRITPAVSRGRLAAAVDTGLEATFYPV